MKDLRERCSVLEGQNKDFDMQMELALARKNTENKVDFILEKQSFIKEKYYIPKVGKIVNDFSQNIFLAVEKLIKLSCVGPCSLPTGFCQLWAIQHF